MKIVGFRIRGAENFPLLIRRFDETSLLYPALHAERSPEEKFAAARYVDDEGHDCFPAGYLKSAMVVASKFAPEHFGKGISRSSIMVVGDGLNGEWVVIEDADRRPMKPLMHVVSFGLTATEAFARSKPFACSAEYKDWSASIRVVYDPDVLNRDRVILLAAAAGELIGLGVWRPETCGLYGRFIVLGHRINKPILRLVRPVKRNPEKRKDQDRTVFDSRVLAGN